MLWFNFPFIFSEKLELQNTASMSNEGIISYKPPSHSATETTLFTSESSGIVLSLWKNGYRSSTNPCATKLGDGRLHRSYISGVLPEIISRR